ncbi:MAG: hypothetical protein AAAB35_25235 [Phyllobacterium sp.]|uniref:hypothetical protein n=1 Tax=Phyllobacterium sp. TaxID=1871046 RepID=UPI0030F25F5F
MADWSPPFANAGEKRLPTPEEVANGFPCGPADQRLFNALFNRVEAELGDLVGFAGITPSDADNTTVRQAVLALIDAATGGNPAGYILMTQARARLPIFPEVINTDGRIIVTSPGTGQVRLPGGVDFLHRGIFTVTTSQTDFATDPSKTYHLRWDPTNGFRLIDVANNVYNPTALVETNIKFDSTFDDIIFARVITNSSNVPTITNLANKNLLTADGYGASAPFGDAGYDPATPSYTIENDVMDPKLMTHYATQTVNFARTPQVYITAIQDVFTVNPPVSEVSMGARALSRYNIAVWAQGDAGHATGWAARA